MLQQIERERDEKEHTDLRGSPFNKATSMRGGRKLFITDAKYKWKLFSLCVNIEQVVLYIHIYIKTEKAVTELTAIWI